MTVKMCAMLQDIVVFNELGIYGNTSTGKVNTNLLLVLFNNTGSQIFF